MHATQSDKRQGRAVALRLKPYRVTDDMTVSYSAATRQSVLRSFLFGHSVEKRFSSWAM